MAPEVVQTPTTVIVDALGAAASAGIGGLAFASTFRLEDLTRPVVAAAVAGAVVSFVMTGLLRRRLGVAALAAVPILFGVALATCGPGASPGAVLTGLVDGPRRILTSAVPMQVEPEVLLVPFALAGAAAFLGTELAQRTRTALAPLLPGLVVLIAGLLFGIDDRLPPGWTPTAWVVVALLVAGWRSNATTVVPALAADTDTPDAPQPAAGRVGGLRGLLAVGLLVVPVVLVARWVEPRAPGNAEERDRRSLRELFDPPADPAAMSSPLVALTGLQTGADDVMFVVDTSAPVERWRQVVLDTYDGTSWTSHASLLPVGAELPGADVVGQRIEQTVEPVGLEGRWLPVADRVVDVKAGDLLFDDTGGVLVAPAKLPERYEAVSIVPTPDTGRLVNATAAVDEEALAARRLPDVAKADLLDDVVKQADEIVAGATSDYAKAAAIERFLADPSPDAPYVLAVDEQPSGHTLGHLRCFLFAGDTCGHRGSTEQFVAAFALLARAADLPTRVVVGFQGSPAPGRDEVTAHDATAWAEVKFAGIGWVAFDPVPDPTLSVTPPTTALPGEQGDAPDEHSDTSTPDGSTGKNDDEGTKSGAGDSATPAWALALGGLTALLVVAVATPGTLRAVRRRRRRRAADAGARLAGAWATVVDELRRGGVPLTPGLAVSDVVATGHEHFPTAAEPLAPLGHLVNRARFARGRATDPDADTAWTLSDAFLTHRRKGRPLPLRLREYLSF